MPEAPATSWNDPGDLSEVRCPLSAPASAACVLIAWLGGRVLAEWNWTDQSGTAHLYPLGVDYGFAAALGGWSAMAAHAVWRRVVGTVAVGAVLIWVIDHDYRVAFATMTLVAAAAAACYSRLLRVQWLLGDAVAGKRSFNFSMRFLLIATTVASFALGGTVFTFSQTVGADWQDWLRNAVVNSLFLTPLLLPAHGACSFVLSPSCTWRHAAWMLLSPLTAAVLFATVVATTPLAEDFYDSSRRWMTFAVMLSDCLPLALGVQCVALVSSATLYWAGYRGVRIAPSIETVDRR